MKTKKVPEKIVVDTKTAAEEPKGLPEATKKVPKTLKTVPKEPKKVPEKPKKVLVEPEKVVVETKKVPEATKKVLEPLQIEALKKEPVIARELVTAVAEKHLESPDIVREKQVLDRPPPTPHQHLEIPELNLQAEKLQHQGRYVCKKISFHFLLTNLILIFNSTFGDCLCYVI